MSDATKIKRTWLGLICPVCRFVFRVPKDHEGNGVICPACNHLLNLDVGKISRKPIAKKQPDPEEQPEKLVAVPRNTAPREELQSKPIVARTLTDEDRIPLAPAPAKKVQRKGRRRKKQPRNRKMLGWDQQTQTKSSTDGSALPWIIGGSLLGLIVVGVGAWLVLGTLDKENKTKPNASSSLPAFTANELAQEAKVELTDEEKKRQQEIQDSVKTGMNVLTDAEDVVEEFLNAASLEEMAACVRTSEITVPRMREWYGDAPWSPVGVKKIGVDGRVTVNGKMASMSVQLPDYTYRQIALERVGSKYKVDWESWVIWSSMPWKDLFDKKPQEPVELRVSCSLDSYYNRLFRDDKKWVAVKLLHPYEDRTLYGYVDKTSPALARLLGDLQSQKISAATIKVKYPKDSVADNQVEIVEYLQSGWVRPIIEE